MTNDFLGLPLEGGNHAATVPALIGQPAANPSGTLVSVCFLRAAMPYNKGDIAGFPQTLADSLVFQKFAEYYKPATSPESATAEKAAGKQGKGKKPPPPVSVPQSPPATDQAEPSLAAGSLLAGGAAPPDAAETAPEGTPDADNA
jgi:hypothetical protein